MTVFKVFRDLQLGDIARSRLESPGTHSAYETNASNPAL